MVAIDKHCRVQHVLRQLIMIRQVVCCSDGVIGRSAMFGAGIQNAQREAKMEATTQRVPPARLAIIATGLMHWTSDTVNVSGGESLTPARNPPSHPSLALSSHPGMHD